MDLRRALIDIHSALERARVRHALIGGLALAVHGAARATADLDLLADGERSADVDRLLIDRGYERLQLTENVGNYLSAEPEQGRVDFLFANRPHGKAMLARATVHEVLGERISVLDAADLIGLKVQAYSNDPSRRHLDLGDIQRLLRRAEVDLARAREYFRIFDREKELDELLSELAQR